MNLKQQHLTIPKIVFTCFCYDAIEWWGGGGCLIYEVFRAAINTWRWSQGDEEWQGGSELGMGKEENI